MESDNKFRKLLRVRGAKCLDITVYVDPSFIYRANDDLPRYEENKRRFDAVRFIALGGSFNDLASKLDVSVGRARDIFNYGIKIINIDYRKLISNQSINDYKVISDRDFTYRRRCKILDDSEFSESQFEYIKGLRAAKKKDKAKVRIAETKLCNQVAIFLGVERAQVELAKAYYSYASSDGFDFGCALDSAFTWEDTVQGFEFWNLINDKVTYE